MLPDMISCNSSCIEEYGYEEMGLYITFVASGDTYLYEGVPEYIFEGLDRASSKGQYFNKYIKDNYRWVKV